MAHPAIRVPFIAGLAVFSASLSSASAEDVARFVLERNGDNGFVRMDVRTGSISVCENQAGELVCRMAADDRAAYEADIERLEERIAALESALCGGTAVMPQTRNDLPSEQDFETTLDYMERFFRRFKGLVDEFGGDNTGNAAPEPMPKQL